MTCPLLMCLFCTCTTEADSSCKEDQEKAAGYYLNRKVHAVNIDNLKTNFACMGITALQQTEN